MVATWLLANYPRIQYPISASLQNVIRWYTLIWPWLAAWCCREQHQRAEAQERHLNSELNSAPNSLTKWPGHSISLVALINISQTFTTGQVLRFCCPFPRQSGVDWPMGPYYQPHCRVVVRWPDNHYMDSCNHSLLILSQYWCSEVLYHRYITGCFYNSHGGATRCLPLPTRSLINSDQWTDLRWEVLKTSLCDIEWWV